MKDIKIINAWTGITEGGMACGPIDGNTVVTVKFKLDGETQYLSLVDVMGIPNFYLSKDNMFTELLSEDFDDEEFADHMNEVYIDQFEDVDDLTDYEAIMEQVEDENISPTYKLIQFIIIIARMDLENAKDFIGCYKGKNIKEFDISEEELEELL